MKDIKNMVDCIWINDCYLMLNKVGEIEMYNENLMFKGKYNVKNTNHITYNEDADIFYLYEGDTGNIYESCDFKNFKRIKINFPKEVCNIKGLSYCKCFKSILITTNNKVFMFDLCTKQFNVIYEQKEKILKINECTMPLGCNSCTEIILIDAVCCLEDIYIAYKKNNKSFIGKLVNGCLKETIYESCYTIKSMFIADCKLKVLIEIDNHISIVDPKIHCCCDNDKNECDCNCGCDKTHRNCNDEIECDCECECKNECDIIGSIASIEKCISKILCSESLKINSAIKKSDNVKDLICVNSSVNETIYYVTVLEFILTEKLKALKKDECKD